MGRKKASNIDIDILIGLELRRRREYKRLTLKEVAVPLGMSYQNWQKYEAGIQSISIYQLFVFCELLKIDIIKFISSINNP